MPALRVAFAQCAAHYAATVFYRMADHAAGTMMAGRRTAVAPQTSQEIRATD